MAREEDFLRRWSRRKLQAAADMSAPAPATVAPAEPVALPSPDSLTFESDFKAFMQAKVEESVKRAALKKLFTDPRFNVMDGLDVYIDDYSVDDPIPQAMLERLEHAKSALRRAEPATEQAQAADEKAGGSELADTLAPDEPTDHDAARKDT